MRLGRTCFSLIPGKTYGGLSHPRGSLSAAEGGGPPSAMKLSDQEVVSEYRQAGFTLAKRLDTLAYQYDL